MVAIDWEYVNNMLSASCTGTEIAATLGIHPNTLYERCKKEQNCDFSEYSAQKKAVGYKMLKLARMEKALNGDTSMQIWLSKQLLGEKDKSETDNNHTVSIPKIKWSDSEE